MVVSSESVAGNTQSKGTVTLDVNPAATSHQVTLVTHGTVTAGTATLKARALGGSVYESVLDSTGAAVSITMTAPVSILWEGVCDSIQVTPTSFDATAYYDIRHVGF